MSRVLLLAAMCYEMNVCLFSAPGCHTLTLLPNWTPRRRPMTYFTSPTDAARTCQFHLSTKAYRGRPILTWSTSPSSDMLF